MRRYDATAVADLKGREAELVTQRGVVATRMNDRAATDKTWEASETNAHAADMATLAMLDSGLKEVRHELDLYAQSAPKANAGGPSPFLRWLRGQDTDSEFTGPKHQVPGGPSGDSFSVPGTPDGFEAAMGRRPQMVTPAVPTGGQQATQANDNAFLAMLTDELAWVGGALAAAYNFPTADGGDMPFISLDDSGNVGGKMTEGIAYADSKGYPSISRGTFKAVTYTSGLMHLSNEMLQDAQYNAEGHVDRTATRRIARGLNKNITEDGADANPMGMITTSKAGVTAASQTAFTATELLKLVYAVNRAYRMGSEGIGDGAMALGGGMIGFMMSDAAEAALREMVISSATAAPDARPLWLPSIRDGVPNTLHGYPIVVNGAMDGLTAGKVPVVFGNFSYYGIRRVAGRTFYRIQDTTTLSSNATGFIAFERRDGRWRLPLESNLVDVAAKLTLKA